MLMLPSRLPSSRRALRKWPNSAVLLWSGFFFLHLNLLASSVSRPLASTTKRARQLRLAPSSSTRLHGGAVVVELDVAHLRSLRWPARPRLAALRNSSSSSSERRTCQAESLVGSQPSAEVDVAAVVEVRRHELDAELRHADLLDLLAHAELVEQLDIAGQQRFADVEARVVFLFEQHHAPPFAREKRGDGRARRSAADDEHIAFLNCLHGVTSPRTEHC